MCALGLGVFLACMQPLEGQAVPVHEMPVATEAAGVELGGGSTAVSEALGRNAQILGMLLIGVAWLTRRFSDP